jgi:hypothetical protein
MRRRSAALVLAGTALAAVSSGAALAGTSPAPPPCEPDGSVTLAETSTARVYQIERRHDDRATLYTYGCLRSTGSQLLLASDAEPSALFPRPAISLVGPFVGYGVDTDTDTSSPGGRITYVEVDDLRPQQPGQETAGLVVSAGPRDVARVGSLKVSRSGAVVWISCPAPSDAPLATDPSGSCTRPGAHDRVYRAKLGRSGLANVVLLDKGTSIDPHSLRRARHSSVTWRHGRTTFVAKLR